MSETQVARRLVEELSKREPKELSPQQKREVEKREEQRKKGEALSHDAKVALAGLSSYYDQEGQYNYERMDPERGGIFAEEFPQLVGLQTTEPDKVIEELKEAGYITVLERPRAVPARAVWISSKGIQWGRELVPQLREEQKEQARRETPSGGHEVSASRSETETPPSRMPVTPGASARSQSTKE